MTCLTRIFAISFALLLLAGCKTTEPVTDAYCDIYDPIRASRMDTPDTLKQVKRQNRAYDELCVKQAAEGMLKK